MLAVPQPDLKRPWHPDGRGALAVYIHWPFCAQKCPYCDFNSHVRHGGWDEGRYLAAYKRALDHNAELIGGGGSVLRLVTSIFFGGGTPSLMQPATVAAILAHIAHLWPVAPDCEITLEGNPGSVEAQRFAGFRAAGVKRVSVGMQSLRDDALKSLGRIHTAAEARTALSIGLATFDRVSADLIYARPGQTEADWRDELGEALALGTRHLSLYQLTIEPGTRFADLYDRGRLVIPDGEAAHALYAATQEMTERAGLAAYEVSNHAAPGEESRHNLAYWRYGPYVGVGPGAHGRVPVGATRVATLEERKPEAWLASVEAKGHAIVESAALGRAEMADEMLLMGLRLAEGLDLDGLAAVGGVAPGEPAMATLEAQGLIVRRSSSPQDSGCPEPLGAEETRELIRSCVAPGLARGASGTGTGGARGRLAATPAGRLVLNRLALELSASLRPCTADGPVDTGD